jgi:phosphoglycolate phosphatase
MKNTSAILFDMDGTLIDSFVGIANAYRYMCKSLGIPEIPDHDVRRLIGPPIEEAIATQFHFESNEVNIAVKYHREYYSSRGIHEYAKYPGTDGLIMGLKDLGFSLYIATSKPTVYAREIVIESGWESFFKGVSGAELDGSRRHKVDVIAWVLQHLAVDESAVAMVGDRTEDVLGGKEHGLSCIGVDWGFNSAEELLEAGASFVATSSAELLTTLSAVG